MTNATGAGRVWWSMRNVNAFCPTFTMYPLPALNASPYSADYWLRCTVLHSEFLRSTRAQREALGRAAIALSDADRCRYVWERGGGSEGRGTVQAVLR